MGYLFDIVIVILAAGAGVWFSSRFHRVRHKMRKLDEQFVIQQVQIDHLQIYKAVVENSPDLFVVVDQSLQVVVVNKTAAEYGLSPSKLFTDSNISDTAKLHFEFELKKVIGTGYSTNGEIRLVQVQHNSWKFFLYHIFPVHDAEDIIIGATVTALDVTAQWEAETELNRQREFAEGIINAIPDAIYVKDDHHRYLYGNKSFSELIGKTPDEYLGLKDSDIYREPNVAQAITRQDIEVIRTNSSQENEEEFKTIEGRKLTLLSKRLPFQFQDGRKVLIAIMRDFSERKKLESELQVSKARQAEASRLATLGETASGIAHEINNPLSVLVGVAELIKIKLSKNGTVEKEKLDEYCDRIVKYSMRIAKIVKGLRSISRDASQDPFMEVQMDVLIDEALELCRHQLENRNVELVLKDFKQEIFVEGRFAQISQIFMNLINNARDAIEGQPMARIHVEVLCENEMAILRVWDSGAGVPIDIEKKIMNPFFTTKPPGKGTGLGLSISKSIALEHKGSLGLNREIADSCFELKLPLLRVVEISDKKIA